MREKHYILTHDRDTRELNIIVKNLPPGCKKILDAPCGYGRISNKLAVKNFDVTGIDISRYFIDIAQEEARNKKLTVRYVTGNILTKKLPGGYDLVLNIFTSLGYLENDKKNEKFIERLCRYVKPGGRLIIETINPIGLFNNYKFKEKIIASDGTTISFERFYDVKTSTNVTRVTEKEISGKVSKLVHVIRLYYPHELINICRNYHCQLASLLNENGKEDDIINSHRIWLIFQKK